MFGNRLTPSGTRASRARSAAALIGLSATLATSLLSVTASPASAANLVANSGFESDTRGWFVSSALGLARVSGGQTGSYSARITNKSTVKTTAVLNDTVNTVAKTVAGTTYDVSAFVRTRNPNVSVNLRLMEYGVGLQGQQNAAVYLTGTSWTKVSLSYKAVKSDSTLDLNVLAWDLAPGKSFDVDNIVLTPRVVVSPTPPTPAGWNLAWADEFNTTSLDRTKWNVDNYSTYGDGNKELACLMDRPENVLQADGALTIRSRREATPLKCGANDARFPNGRDYSSAMLTTKGKADFLYGRFEVRAKLPTQANTSKGLWPAFWLRPTSGGTGEIDIMEAVGSGVGGTEYNKVHQTIHYDYVPTYSNQNITYTLPTGTPSDGYHVYAAEWEPGVIRFYVDGKLTFERNRTTTSWIDSTFNKPFYIRLNTAVGGTWPGTPDASTAFPADYKIDYVRVYKR